MGPWNPPLRCRFSTWKETAFRTFVLVEWTSCGIPGLFISLQLVIDWLPQAISSRLFFPRISHLDTWPMAVRWRPAHRLPDLGCVRKYFTTVGSFGIFRKTKALPVQIYPYCTPISTMYEKSWVTTTATTRVPGESVLGGFSEPMGRFLASLRGL